MVLGMSLATFTMVHVIISLIGIVSGIIVMFGMLGSHRPGGLTAIFLLFTILTSVTGFPFPFEGFKPSYVIAVLSLVLLLIACIALYGMKLDGSWRWIYAVTALVSLYLNCFVLVIQSFLKIPALTALAPGNPPSGPVFGAVQGIVLLFFIVMIVAAVKRFRPALSVAVSWRSSSSAPVEWSARACCANAWSIPASSACCRWRAGRAASRTPSSGRSCIPISSITPRSNPN